MKVYCSILLYMADVDNILHCITAYHTLFYSLLQYIYIFYSVLPYFIL